MKLLIAPFRRTEVSDDGTVTVEGIASTEAVDSAGEIVKASAIEAALPEFRKWPALREMHGQVAAGKVTSIAVTSGKTLIEALVVDPGTVRKIQLGVLRAFSIGGKILVRDPKDPKVITKLALSEVSIVDVPCNKECAVTLWK